MKERMWLRHGDERRSFPLKEVGKSRNMVMVKQIADVWNLKASAISIGENLLDSSSVEVEEMRELAAECGQAGDGRSRESAIEIKGRKKKEKDESLGRAVERKRPRNAYERAKMRERGPSAEDRARAARYVKWDSVRRAFFYGPGCMYEYAGELEINRPSPDCKRDDKLIAFEELMFRSVRPFIGTLHVLSSDQRQQLQEVEDGQYVNVVGMVALWRLDGECLTAYKCVKDALSSDRKLYVRMQPVPGKNVVYECKAEEVEESWALLKPAEPDKIGYKFTQCMRLRPGVSPGPVNQYTFSLEEGGELKNVRAASVWVSADSTQTILPASRMCCILGAPVFHTDATISGIVTEIIDVDKQPSDINMVELEALVHRYKKMNIYRQVFLEGLRLKQVVRSTWTELDTLVDEWRDKHPIEEVCPLEEVALDEEEDSSEED